MSARRRVSAEARSETAILAGIREVLETMDVRGAVALETHIRRDLDLDSMRRIELAIEAENRFRVVLQPEDEEGIETIGDLVRVIRDRLDARVGTPGDDASGGRDD